MNITPIDITIAPTIAASPRVATPASTPPPAPAPPVDAISVSVQQQSADVAADARPMPQQSEVALRALNEYLQPHSMSLNMYRDEATRSIVVELIDERSGEVLRQVPDDARRRISEMLGRAQGNLVSRQA